MPENWFATNAPKATPPAGGNWFSANAPTSSPAAQPVDADYTTNPKREGTYQMVSESGGAISVPYSQVIPSSKVGYRIKSGDLEKYAKDRTAELRKTPGATEDDLMKITLPEVVKADEGKWAKISGRVMSATEPTNNFPGMTPSLQPNDPVGGEMVMNALKRAGRVLFGAVDLPHNVLGILSDLASNDPRKSVDAEKRLNDLHPGAQLSLRGKEFVSDWKKDPKLALANVGGDVAGMWITDKATTLVLKSPKLPGAIGERIRAAAVGKQPVRTMVAETGAANAREIATAGIKNAEQDAARKTELQQHFDKTQEVRQSNADAAGKQTHKAGLERGVEHLDPEFKEDLGKVEDRVNVEANRQYNELNARLDDKPAEAGTLPKMLEEASEKIKGSNTETPIFRDMEKRFNSSDPLTYRDLQGYRSELGRELRKGTLPGDVFHAYKGMEEAVTDAMEGIAKKSGELDAFRKARAYYKGYADTFLDRSSPIRKALDSTERGQAIQAFQGKDQSGVAALAKYDPALAQRANTIRGHQADAKAIPGKEVTPKADPVLPPKPARIEPNIQRVGPDEVRQARLGAVNKRIDWVRNRGEWVATGAGFYGALRGILHGSVSQAAESAIFAGAAVYATEKIASYLERPDVQQWLSTPTAGDLQQLEKLPAEQRAVVSEALAPIVKEAKAKGIRVAPSIIALTTATQQPLGTHMKSLQAIRAKYAN